MVKQSVTEILEYLKSTKPVDLPRNVSIDSLIVLAGFITILQKNDTRLVSNVRALHKKVEELYTVLEVLLDDNSSILGTDVKEQIMKLVIEHKKDSIF